MSERDQPLSAVLSQLRAELRDGRHPPGEPLSISGLAARLGFSPTPVREALAHLAGEGLVAERRRHGYFAAPLDAEGLAERYRLHQLYVFAALEAPKPHRLAAFRDARPASGDPTEELFGEIVAAASDGTLADAHRRLGDQLAAARCAERRLWGNLETELLGLRRLLIEGDLGALKLACAAYHERRRDAASDLTVLIRAGNRTERMD